MSARAAAKVAGVTPSTYQEWLSGSQPRNFEAVLKLADYFNVTMTYLLVGRQERGRDEGLPAEVVKAVTPIFEGYLEVKITKLIPKANSEDN